jgi:hypothetical protein
MIPRWTTGLAYRITGQSLVLGLISGLTGGLLAGFSAGLAFGLSAGLVAGFSVGLVSGLANVAFVGLARHKEGGESSLGPADVWRHDRNAGPMYVLVSGFLTGFLALLTAGLVPGFASALASGLASGLPVVLSVGLPAGFAAGLWLASIVKRMGAAASMPGSAAVDTALATVHLAIRHQIPVRLIAFLEDARSRHLLRTVGPVYQFRHATLQAQLAQTEPERSSPARQSIE